MPIPDRCWGYQEDIYLRAIPYKSARESDERFFVIKRYKTAGILCVFQGFTSEFLAEKVRQSPQTHLCGIALGLTMIIIRTSRLSPVPIGP